MTQAFNYYQYMTLSVGISWPKPEALDAHSIALEAHARAMEPHPLVMVNEHALCKKNKSKLVKNKKKSWWHIPW